MERDNLNKLVTSSNSYALTKRIKAGMSGRTFHLHYHIIYDLATYLNKQNITYAEIGVFHGGSLSLALQHPCIKTIVGIDPLVVHGDQESNIMANIAQYNQYNAKVVLVKKFSTDPTVPTEVRDKAGLVDILFIDGDHSYLTVVSDFEQYQQLVIPGGYIIFDDYHDSVYSPEVFTAVNEIVYRINHHKYHESFELIGQLDNITDEPTGFGWGLNNEFIVKKKNNICFTIVIATYYRKNGSTLNYLTRCLDSIKKQTYSNWMIYLVGDDYEKVDELMSFQNQMTDRDRIKIFNKPDPERNHISNKDILWRVAGASAINYGLHLIRKEGHRYYTHLDDDDFWDSNHLSLLADAYDKYPQCIFAYTRSTYPNRCQIPFESVAQVFENNLPPRGGNVIHSSFSFRCDIIPYDYHTTHIENEVIGPADAIMVDKIRDFILAHPTYTSVFIPELTCHHDEEGVSRKKIENLIDNNVQKLIPK